MLKDCQQNQLMYNNWKAVCAIASA
jgi:hypothetical protein